MPLLERPDGVEINWWARGEGPLVVIANQFVGGPWLYTALVDDLARDHRVVQYDPRGAGESTREGPYDLDTDAADLGAVIDAAGEAAVILGVSDGNNRAAHLAAQRRDAVSALIAMAGSTMGGATIGSDALAGSGPVLSSFATLMGSDLRAGVHTMFTTGNASIDDERLHERIDQTVAYTDAEAASGRLRAWIRDPATDEASSLGDRLWILAYGGNPWFPVDLAERTRAALPEAHVMEVEDGPMSRPDITAAVVRRITLGT